MFPLCGVAQSAALPRSAGFDSFGARIFLPKNIPCFVSKYHNALNFRIPNTSEQIDIKIPQLRTNIVSFKTREARGRIRVGRRLDSTISTDYRRPTE